MVLSSHIFGPPSRITDKDSQESLPLCKPVWLDGLVHYPIYSPHLAPVTMTEARQLSKIRRRRGVVRSSITRLEKRLQELEELSEQPTTSQAWPDPCMKEGQENCVWLRVGLVGGASHWSGVA